MCEILVFVIGGAVNVALAIAISWPTMNEEFVNGVQGLDEVKQALNREWWSQIRFATTALIVSAVISFGMSVMLFRMLKRETEGGN